MLEAAGDFDMGRHFVRPGQSLVGHCLMTHIMICSSDLRHVCAINRPSFKMAATDLS